MSPSFHLDAPAKVNLGLRIVGRRDDGLHQLESLFVPLDLADAVGLRVETAVETAVELYLIAETSGVPVGEDNLACRAAHAFLDRAGIAAHVEISLTKHTPVAAGLGGGSSDAAAVLRGLGRAFPDAFDREALTAVALGLGADVPFFLDPRPAWVTGIGEQNEPVPDVPSLSLLLANPGEHLATGRVFQVHDALGGTDVATTARQPLDTGSLAAALGAAETLGPLLHNDLEAAALRLCPAIARLRKQLLAQGALAVGLSGSGATLFGVFPDPVAAEAAGADLSLRPPAWCRVARTHESR